MLRPLKKQELDQYLDFAYTLALDLTCSTYPTYCDGIKTRADFAAQAIRSFDCPHEEILLFTYEKAVEGWIHYYALPEDRYVSFCAFNIRSHAAEAVDEIVAYLSRKFARCTLYFGLPTKNEEVIFHLQTLGFRKEDENFVDVLHFDDYQAGEPVPGIVRVTKKNFSEFARLHQVHDDDMYWNNLRLRAAIEDWNIFLLYEADRAVGAIYFTYVDSSIMEIFGTDFAGGQFDPAVFRRLLTHALNEGKGQGMRHLVFFTGEEDHPVTRELGFQLVSQYVLYARPM